MKIGPCTFSVLDHTVERKNEPLHNRVSLWNFVVLLLNAADRVFPVHYDGEAQRFDVPSWSTGDLCNVQDKSICALQKAYGRNCDFWRRFVRGQTTMYTSVDKETEKGVVVVLIEVNTQAWAQMFEPHTECKITRKWVKDTIALAVEYENLFPERTDIGFPTFQSSLSSNKPYLLANSHFFKARMEMRMELRTISRHKAVKFAVENWRFGRRDKVSGGSQVPPTPRAAPVALLCALPHDSEEED